MAAGGALRTVGVRKGDFRLEITTFRSDSYREDSRKPEVTFGRSISEDLARRDFTVNAMAMAARRPLRRPRRARRPGRQAAAHLQP